MQLVVRLTVLLAVLAPVERSVPQGALVLSAVSSTLVVWAVRVVPRGVLLKGVSCGSGVAAIVGIYLDSSVSDAWRDVLGGNTGI